MKMIASNKLYEPVLNEGGDKEDLVILPSYEWNGRIFYNKVAAWSNQKAHLE